MRGGRLRGGSVHELLHAVDGVCEVEAVRVTRRRRERGRGGREGGRGEREWEGGERERGREGRVREGLTGADGGGGRWRRGLGNGGELLDGGGKVDLEDGVDLG